MGVKEQTVLIERVQKLMAYMNYEWETDEQFKDYTKQYKAHADA